MNTATIVPVEMEFPRKFLPVLTSKKQVIILVGGAFLCKEHKRCSMGFVSGRNGGLGRSLWP